MTNLDQKVRELRALAEKWLEARARPASNIPRVLVGSRELDAFEEAARPETMLAILDEYDRRGAALVEAAKAIEALQAEVERLSAAPPAMGREEIAGALRDMAFNIRWRVKEFDEAVAGAADAILSALGRTEALTPPEGDGLTLGG